MSDKLKKIMQTPEVPEELRPENIPSLIRRNNIKHKKNNNIIKYVSALTACAVIGLCTVHFLPKEEKLYQTEPSLNSEEIKSDDAETIENETVADNLYFNSINSYEEIYSQMSKNYVEYKEQNKISLWDKLFGGVSKNDAMINGAVMEDGAVLENEMYAEESTDDLATGAGDMGSADTSEDVYDTLQQVEGIAEADIVKATSDCVYFAKSSELVSVPFDNETGTFGEKHTLSLLSDNYDNEYVSIHEMYLSENKLIVICYSEKYNDDYNETFIKPSTVVMIYDISNNIPELIENYYQSGNYSDSRMKDNILYLTTNQNEYYRNITDEKTYEQYIPTCGNSYEDMDCIPPEHIYIPDDWNNKSLNVNYVNIAGIDINSPSEPVSIVSVAGYNGELYCSGENIYLTQTQHYNGNETTKITRFSTENGVVTPQSSGSVKGYVLNQFSMDEYNGYFRIATTSNNNSYNYYDETEDVIWSENNRSNNVFVLDMDLKTVGAITGIAETESIKSVTFKGDIGYVVTYEQTDPLFAIDFSDPCNPVITDEFKITGYSSFLYNWSDDLLLGFGIDADENAIERGVKLVMFDVSDNGDLKECGMYKISDERFHGGIYSQAVYERKALLLNSERNIIGFPVTFYNTNSGYPLYSYHLFSYENGEFKEIGAVSSEINGNYSSEFIRGIYIGDYLCVFSYDEIVCAELNTMNITDRIQLF